MNADKTVLVTGATGQQGGAVARRLLTDGWHVRALTRDTSSAAAEALAEAGAEVIAGDLDDRSTVDATLEGAYGLFSVHPGGYTGGPYESDPQHEVRSAGNLAEAAKAAGTRIVVHSSAGGVDGPLGESLEFMRLKAAAEARFTAADVPVAFLRPASFMENMVSSQRGLRDGALTTPMLEHKKDPMIAVDDIAVFAALAFADPERYAGRAIELAGDSLTPREIVTALGAAFDREVPFHQVPMEALRAMSEQFAEIVETVNGHESVVDVDALRAEHPGLLTFDAWVKGAGRQRLAEHFAQADTANG